MCEGRSASMRWSPGNRAEDRAGQRTTPPLDPMPPPSRGQPPVRVKYKSTLVSTFLLFTLLASATTAQQCPPTAKHTNTHLLMANSTRQHISAFDKGYDADVECRWIIKSTSPNHQVELTIQFADLEDMIFGTCADFIEVFDVKSDEGSTPKLAKDLGKWCGQATAFPPTVVSGQQTLMVHFRSDAHIQRRGFNLSYVEIPMFGCPDGWRTRDDSTSCYKLVTPTNQVSWVQAQDNCLLEDSNLATMSTNSEYAEVISLFSKEQSTYPWVGYHDSATEGTFESIISKEKIWPEPQFVVTSNNAISDCVYLDFAADAKESGDGTAHQVDDCRRLHSYICKKNKNGATVLYETPRGYIRQGLVNDTVDYTIWLLALVALVLILILLCICCQTCVGKKEQQRVHPNDQNQRLVRGVDRGAVPPNNTQASTQQDAHQQQQQNTVAATATLAAPRTPGRSSPLPLSTTITNEEAIAANTAGVHTTASGARLAGQEGVELRPLPPPPEAGSLGRTRVQEIQAAALAAQHTQQVVPVPAPRRRTPPTSPPRELPPIGETSLTREHSELRRNLPLPVREATMGSMLREESFVRTKRTNELFDRPKINMLDNVSAISLDEFWNTQK